ncbi:hypothetical protein [Sorangium cellulosum]|uniref:CD-NTase-associated protein 15 domain-containing protein n=1 Tax=Sorangium cellulosum TaxID=56 RepID=A0A150QB02_SORCE|nr:hypothetical protein [Sorangium cellulosum]KYF65103.1 hypothetical protein BE15_26140 [Sorangium cellulosum]
MSRAPLTILVLFGAALWALVLSGHGWPVPLSFFTPLSAVVSGLSVLLLLWDAWLWRLDLLHPWPVSQPVLRGTWRGQLTPATGEPLPIFLVVEQTFSTVETRTFTDESRSASIAARLDRVDGDFLLAAVYRNEPDLRLQKRSRVHRGAVALRVHGPRPAELRGCYWTDRDTKGELHFERVSRQLASDFKSAAALARAAPAG